MLFATPRKTFLIIPADLWRFQKIQSHTRVFGSGDLSAGILSYIVLLSA
jgi:hypothetical protein